MSTPSWRDILRQNFTQWEKLADYLELTPAQRTEILPHSHFPLNLPLRLANKITKGTLEDPILRQFLPMQQELSNRLEFIDDPVSDQSFRVANKLLRKYQGRVLLVCTSACAMNCRFCFRQNFDYEVDDKGFEQELAIITNDSSIHEVILSGGDPLSLSDRVLEPLLQSLAAIPHVKRIRFHTRFPIGIPERLDDNFLKILASIPKQIWFVIHTNHPKELDAEVIQRLNALRKQGAVVLSQTVLLRGVNDDVETLKDLCLNLVDNGIFPYYLHQLDRVKGVGHFEVPIDEGKRFITELMALLPGYAVPKYMQEIPGELSKTPLY